MGRVFAWMEPTERTLQSPGEESAPVSETMRNAHCLGLETLGLRPTKEGTGEMEEGGGAEDEQLAAHS